MVAHGLSLSIPKSGGAVDNFNSPQVLGFLSKLFKAILPPKRGKEDCIGTTESTDYPGGLHSSNLGSPFQAGLCATTPYSSSDLH